MKAYIMLSDGCEEVEALETADILKRAGVETVLVSPFGAEIVTGSHGFRLVTDRQFASTDSYDAAAFGDADAVVVPGGKLGTENNYKNAALLEMLRAYNAAGRTVCAVCAGPTVLARAGILDGHKATCYPGFEGGLAGAEFVGGPAVVSGNIITGKSLGCTVDFALAIVERLLGAEAARKVGQQIYRS